MKLFPSLAAAVVATVIAYVPVQAKLYSFVITGDYSASFQLDSSPIPDLIYTGGFETNAAQGFTDTQSGSAEVYFYNQSGFGGLQIIDPINNHLFISSVGPQLYSGSEAAPTFLTGTFAMTQFSGFAQNYSVTISESIASVPEPATWALMIGGLGMIGCALRRRTAWMTAVNA